MVYKRQIERLDETKRKLDEAIERNAPVDPCPPVPQRPVRHEQRQQPPPERRQVARHF